MTRARSISTFGRLVTALVMIAALVPGRALGQPAAADPAERPIDPQRLRAAVDAGLRWLSEQQVTDGGSAGSWEGGPYPVAVTSVAGLAFLAHGHLANDESYGETVRGAMAYVLEAQGPDGYLGARGQSMYIHAMATLFALSYLGMAEDLEREPELAAWCRRAITLTVDAQKVRKMAFDQGGWRYSPQARTSDISVTSWQLLSLHAARQCGYEIRPNVFDEGLRYVNSAWVEGEEGEEGEEGDKGFVYRPGVSIPEPEPGVTGAALGVLRLLNQPRDERTQQAMDFLHGVRPSWGGPQYKGYFYFVNFYLALGYFQNGGEAWTDYRRAAYRVLLEHQKSDGRWTFPPGTRGQVTQTGDVYATAMALLVLGIENQYLPAYQRQAELFASD